MSNLKDLYLVIFLIFLAVYLFLNLICLKHKIQRQRESFIKTLNHDIKVALLAQLRGLDFLREKSERDKESKDLIYDIHDSCMYSIDMLTMLSEIYRYENGEILLTPICINPSDLLQQLIETDKNEFLQKGIRIFDKLDNFSMDADENSLLRVFKIILKFIESHAYRNSEVYFSIKKEKNNMDLQIVYSGNGISEEERKRMFDKNPRFSAVGHGIQMYLCKKIVDFQDGNIKIVNKNNKINIVKVTIPLEARMRKKHLLVRCLDF